MIEMTIRNGITADGWMAALAHELRSPLSTITLALDTLRPACDDAAAREACDLAELGSRQMARIIEDVLDMSLGGHGDPAPFGTPTNLVEAAATAIAVVRPLIVDAGHRLTIELPRSPVLVSARQSRLLQILTNLLINAAKYTNPGGNVGLTVARDGDAALVRVSDNGIGIVEDLLPRIFEFRRRGEAAEVHGRGGLGIGLAVVKTLVELEGGCVSAASAGPGFGSEFVVRLPLRRDRSSNTALDEAFLGKTIATPDRAGTGAD